MYYIYLVRCKDNTLYCGQTNNLEKRLADHNSSLSRSAKYTKGRGPVILEYYEQVENLSDALKKEWALKKLTKKQKEILVYNFKNRKK